VQNLMRAHVEGLEIVSAGLAHEIHNPLNFIKNANLLIAENVGKLQATLAGSDRGAARAHRGHREDPGAHRQDGAELDARGGADREGRRSDPPLRREGYPTERRRSISTWRWPR
jgi:hypothetical protein